MQGSHLQLHRPKVFWNFLHRQTIWPCCLPTSINRFGTNLVIGKFSTTFLVSSTAKSFGDAGNSETPSADAVAGVIPAYTVMDWSGTIRIKNYNIKMGVNNLADQSYFTKRTDEYPGPGIIPAIGRSFYLGFGAKF